MTKLITLKERIIVIFTLFKTFLFPSFFLLNHISVYMAKISFFVRKFQPQLKLQMAEKVNKILEQQFVQSSKQTLKLPLV